MPSRLGPLRGKIVGDLGLLTSLDPDDWPPDRLITAYRLRWQVELAFKRLNPLSDWKTCGPATPIWREPGSTRRC